ncbi:hypothetical protein [Castellaniella sp. UC4442_H9]|jgi:hypothetical protein
MDPLDSFSSAWQVVSAELVLVLGLFVAKFAGQAFGTPLRRALMLYAWHTAICFVAVWYALQNGADALDYYMHALAGDIEFRAGTAAVSFVTVLFASTLRLSFLGTTLVYQTLGFIGLLALDASLRLATAGKHRYTRLLATLTVLLPSISFWSSLIGKDAISFLSMGLTLWAALNLGRRLWLMVAAVALMLMVRPHIAGIMVMALAGSFVVKRKVPIGRRILLGGAALAASVVIVPYALNYSGLGENADATDLSAYIDHRQAVSEVGTTSIDLSSMSPPMQLFAYLFRPLPYEAGSAFGLIASMDNVLLLLLCGLGLWNRILGRRGSPLGNRTFMWLYVLITWTVLAVTTANLGISLRQKWMFAPVLMFLLLSRIGRIRLPASAPRHPVPVIQSIRQPQPQRSLLP